MGILMAGETGSAKVLRQESVTYSRDSHMCMNEKNSGRGYVGQGEQRLDALGPVSHRKCLDCCL